MNPRMKAERTRSAIIKFCFEVLLLSICTSAVPVPTTTSAIVNETGKTSAKYNSPVIQHSSSGMASGSEASQRMEISHINRDVNSLKSSPSENVEKIDASRHKLASGKVVKEPFKKTARVLVRRQFPKLTKSTKKDEKENALSRLSIFSFVHPALTVGEKAEKDEGKVMSQWKNIKQIFYRSAPLKGTEERDRNALGLGKYQEPNSTQSQTMQSATDKSVPKPVSKSDNQMKTTGNSTTGKMNTEFQRNSGSKNIGQAPVIVDKAVSIEGKQHTGPAEELHRSFKEMVSGITNALGDIRDLMGIGLGKLKDSIHLDKDDGYEKSDVARMTNSVIQELVSSKRSISTSHNSTSKPVQAVRSAEALKEKLKGQKGRGHLNHLNVGKEEISKTAKQFISRSNLLSEKSKSRLLEVVREEVEKRLNMNRVNRV